MARDLPIIREEALEEALAHLRTALELLDRAKAPGHIGAHVDLAMCQLQDEIGSDSGTSASVPLGTNSRQN
jgi:hypothetical protein